MENLFGETDRLDAVVTELRKYPGWPSDDTKDREFAREILATFTGLNVEAEILAWRTWMMDHEQKKQVKPRARFLRWLRTARGDFGRHGGADRAGAPQRRTSTTARGVDAFGHESSSALGRW